MAISQIFDDRSFTILFTVCSRLLKEEYQLDKPYDYIQQNALYLSRTEFSV